MPVFHNLMAVGVSGAITFTYLGQGIAVPVSVESTEKTSTENSISQRSFKQNLAKSQSAQSTADAAQAKNQPSELLHQPSQADSDPLEASWKENPTKPSQRRILNRLTPSTATEKLTLNKAESSVQRAFKQNPVKPTPTNSTAQRSIVNHFTTPGSQTPSVENSQSSGETVFKENPTKPTQTNSTAQRSILNPFTTPGSQTPSVENSQSSGETVFKENPTKPTQTNSTAQRSIVNHFTTPGSQTPSVENSQSSGETVFKENPTKPTPTDSTAQRSIVNHFTTPGSQTPSVENSHSSGETVFKENPTKPTPTDSTVQRILNKFIYPTARNRPTVENSEPTEETVFKENPVKPSAGNESPIPSPLNPSNSSQTASQPQSPNPVEVSLTENREKSSNPTPNLFELSQMLPQPPGANLPPQIAQETNTPTLEVPNLSPPNEPYPQPTPSGILETNPPPITFPSSNPLYRPNQPRDVEIQETVPITLPQAVDLARRNNEGIRVFELQVEQNLAALRSAQADLYPTLSYISNLTRAFSAGEDISNSARNRGVRARATPEQAISLSRTFGFTTFENTLQIQYDFDLSGARGARIKAGEEQLRLARLEFERSVEQLRLDVTEAYYNLQEADAEVEIQRAAVRNSQKSLEDAEALERAGVGTRFEVLQARVTLSRVQQDLTNAISNQRTRRRELANILNVSQNVNLIAADAISLAGAWDFTLDESIVLAYQNRAELEQELVNRNLAEQRRIAARAAQRPNLTTSANYNVLGRLDDNSSPFDNQGWADGYDIQFQLRWNFFDGGLAKANARQQEINIAIAEERYSELRNDIRLEVESAFYDLQATFENIGVANLGVEEATEALRLARLRFQAGVGTQLDVINQETDLTRAQNQLLQAIIGYNRSLSRLHRAVSNLPGNNLQDTP
jgi:outer membrane protein TolC